MPNARILPSPNGTLVFGNETYSANKYMTYTVMESAYVINLKFKMLSNQVLGALLFQYQHQRWQQHWT